MAKLTLSVDDQMIGLVETYLAAVAEPAIRAVTAAAARSASCDYIVTRNIKEFRGSPLPCFAPESMALLIGTS